MKIQPSDNDGVSTMEKEVETESVNTVIDAYFMDKE